MTGTIETIQRAREANRIMSAKNPTLAEFLKHWLEGIRSHRSHNTWRTYDAKVRNQILPTLGAKRLYELTSHDIALWDRTMTGGTASRRKAHSVLSCALAAAVQQRILINNPCAAIPAPRHEKKPIEPFTKNEAKRLLDAVETSPLRALFHLALKLGLRQGELLGLQTGDIDHDRRRLLVQRQVQYGAASRLKTKSSNRVLPINPQLLDVLHKHQVTTSPWLFADGDNPWKREKLIKLHWHPLLAQLELAQRPFHNLRHTCATLMLQSGTGIHVVSRILGHKNILTTLDTYVHYMPADGEDALDKLDDLLG